MSEIVDELLNFFEQREGQSISDVDIEAVMEKAALRIDDLEAKQHWISVEDRLPESGEVLCYFSWGWMQIIDLEHVHKMVERDLTHWMPLPAPPTGEADK